MNANSPSVVIGITQQSHAPAPTMVLQPSFTHIRNGSPNALRTVVIQLQSEDHIAVVQEWKLLRARIIKHTSGPLNAKGNDVAMEEIVLAYERLELE